MNKTSLALLISALLLGCQQQTEEKQVKEEKTAVITIDDAKKYVADAEKSLEADYEIVGKAYWIQANFVTDDTSAVAAKFGEESTKKSVALALGTKQFKDLELDYDTRRKLDALKSGLVLPAPSDDAKTAELSKITSNLDATYAKGCTAEGECFGIYRTTSASIIS